jgi:uncharacterized protein YutE (UPF0331/DUF86 family)
MTIPADIEARILDKAEYVEEALTILSEKQALDRTTYQENREQQAIVEREFQTAIEACIDIAGLLLRALDKTMPETYAERFSLLEDHGVLSSETSEQMRKAAGFRNILVHRYGDEIENRRYMNICRQNCSGSSGIFGKFATF